MDRRRRASHPRPGEAMMSERRLPDKPGWWWIHDVPERSIVMVQKSDYYGCLIVWNTGSEVESRIEDPSFQWIGPVNPDPLPWPDELHLQETTDRKAER